MVYIPDDSDFSSFRDQCESLEGWHCRYNKAGVTVWSQGQEESCTVQKIKVSRCFPAPAVCPAAPEGPWGQPRAGDAQSHLPGRVSALNSRAGRVRTPEVLPSCCCPPRGFTCRAHVVVPPVRHSWEGPGISYIMEMALPGAPGHDMGSRDTTLVSFPWLCHPGAHPPHTLTG